MRCDYVFVCDHAQDSRDGKLHALGIGWAELRAASVPVRHPHMTFVAGLQGTIAESGKKSVKLSLIDADGADIIPPLEAEVELRVREPAIEGRLNIVLNLNGLQFPQFGQYAFHLVIQGNELARVPFSVVEAAPTN